MELIINQELEKLDIFTASIILKKYLINRVFYYFIYFSTVIGFTILAQMYFTSIAVLTPFIIIVFLILNFYVPYKKVKNIALNQTNLKLNEINIEINNGNNVEWQNVINVIEVRNTYILSTNINSLKFILISKFAFSNINEQKSFIDLLHSKNKL